MVNANLGKYGKRYFYFIKCDHHRLNKCFVVSVVK